MNENSEIRWLHESAMVKLEANNRRMFILCVILLIVVLVTNGAWLYYESQFKTEVTTMQEIEAEQEATGGGNNFIIGGDYGETKGKSNNDNH